MLIRCIKETFLYINGMEKYKEKNIEKCYA